MVTAKNTCLSESTRASNPREIDSGQTSGLDSDVPNPADLLQEYTELRERFQRTTNALASAAHDLKTPLSILNGYVELLQSEKLGSLNERQGDVFREIESGG